MTAWLSPFTGSAHGCGGVELRLQGKQRGEVGRVPDAGRLLEHRALGERRGCQCEDHGERETKPRT